MQGEDSKSRSLRHVNNHDWYRSHARGSLLGAACPSLISNSPVYQLLGFGSDDSAWFISWIAFSFVFDAICIALEEGVAGLSKRSDSLSVSFSENSRNTAPSALQAPPVL